MLCRMSRVKANSVLCCIPIVMLTYNVCLTGTIHPVFFVCNQISAGMPLCGEVICTGTGTEFCPAVRQK